VLADKTFCNHPTPKRYGFRSYISVPINLPDGRFFGTLCAIDPQPARVGTPQIVEMFKLFADLIGMHLAAQECMHAAQAQLTSEREAAQLRDQFIAVLGHDLRNPLSAIQSSVQLLEMLPHDPEAKETLGIMQRSVNRMAALIGNVLDLARGRLGGGIPVRRAPAPNLAKALEQVVTELQTSSPQRRIEFDLRIAEVVSCDAERIAQLLSNLLGNAVTHGDGEGPIRVRGVCDSEGFDLSVTNTGPTIPPQIIAHLFKPFSRGSARPGQQGLGLGLYIASEIARAHGGTLTVKSTDSQTCFTFRMPAAK
jgi:signal transduction histidine kinase